MKVRKLSSEEEASLADMARGLLRGSATTAALVTVIMVYAFAVVNTCLALGNILRRDADSSQIAWAWVAVSPFIACLVIFVLCLVFAVVIVVRDVIRRRAL